MSIEWWGSYRLNWIWSNKIYKWEEKAMTKENKVMKLLWKAAMVNNTIDWTLFVLCFLIFSLILGRVNLVNKAFGPVCVSLVCLFMKALTSSEGNFWPIASVPQKEEVTLKVLIREKIYRWLVVKYQLLSLWWASPLRTELDRLRWAFSQRTRIRGMFSGVGKT